jgi:threonine dehydrogenase-like Zn-dependent dehydrogenase
MTSNPQPRPHHPSSGDWKFLPLLLIPVACCALVPLAIAGIAAVGAGIVGGATAALVVLAVGVGLIIVSRRQRQRRSCSTENGTADHVTVNRQQQR